MIHLPPRRGHSYNDLQAIHALDCGKLYEAYELYLAAGMYDAAHDIAVLELAPDAVIRQDLMLLRELFEVFDGRPVNGWTIRGKVSFLTPSDHSAAVLTQNPMYSFSSTMWKPSRAFRNFVTV